MRNTWIVAGSVCTIVIGGFVAYRTLKKRKKLSSPQSVKETQITMEQQEVKFKEVMGTFGGRLNAHGFDRFGEAYQRLRENLSHIPDQDYLNEVNDKLLELIKWSNSYYEGNQDDFGKAMLVQESIDFYESLKKSRAWLSDNVYADSRSAALDLSEMAIEIMYAEGVLPDIYSVHGEPVLAVVN